MKKSRTLLAAAAAIAGLVAFAGSAQAAPPRTISFDVNLPGTDTDGANGYCEFPVVVHVTTSSQFTPPTSTTHFAGFGSAVVEGNGKTLTLNISGPGTVTNNNLPPFTIDAGGPNLLWTTVANSFPGVPQLNYTTGHVKVTVDGTGKTTSFTLSGRSTDVCALLAN